jgi:hypothetical protein
VRDLNGVAALAVALLWIAYLVPHLLRHRQQLLESCAEDRFSGALRVLAVTDRQGRALRAGEARADCGPGAQKRSGLFAPGRGKGAQVHRVVAVTGGRIVDRPHGTQDKIGADAARRIAQRRAQRAASVARRGAAARRRGVLTAVLLALTAASWLVVGITSAAVLVAVAPTVVLSGVLVLGRRAVIHARAADAAWDRQQHPPIGTPRTDPGQPVIGRAYHPSDSMTEVIARVRDDAAASSGEPPAQLRSGPAMRAIESTTRASTIGAPQPGASQPGASKTGAAGPVEEPGAVLMGAADGGAVPADVGAAPWSPVPVPRPVYTTKATAPRREPIPLVLDGPRSSAAAIGREATEPEQAEPAAPGQDGAGKAAAAPAGASSAADGPVALEAVGGSPNPTLDLDAILARRRTAG